MYDSLMPRPGVSAVVSTILFPAFVFLTAGEVIKGLGGLLMEGWVPRGGCLEGMGYV